MMHVLSLKNLQCWGTLSGLKAPEFLGRTFYLYNVVHLHLSCLSMISTIWILSLLFKKIATYYGSHNSSKEPISLYPREKEISRVKGRLLITHVIRGVVMEDRISKGLWGNSSFFHLGNLRRWGRDWYLKYWQLWRGVTDYLQNLFRFQPDKGRVCRGGNDLLHCGWRTRSTFTSLVPRFIWG